MEELKVTIDGKEHIVKIEEDGNKLKVHLEGKVFEVESSLTKEQKDYDIKDSSGADREGVIKAALPGVIFSVDVKEGDEVKKGQKLLSLVAMKMENQVLAPTDGKITTLHVKKEDKVNKGDVLIEIQK